MTAPNPHVRTWPCPTIAHVATNDVHGRAVRMRPHTGVGELAILRRLVAFTGDAQVAFEPTAITVHGPRAHEAADDLAAAGLCEIER